MGRIEWETLITEGQGKISLHRLRKFSTIVAFWFGVLVAVIATLVEVVAKVEVPTSMVMILVAALIAPVMGGQLSDAIFAKKNGNDRTIGKRDTGGTWKVPAVKDDR